MKKILLIVNRPAYGTDETFNALRLAVALGKLDDAQVTVFLMGDAVSCAIAGQKTPTGTTPWTGCSRASLVTAA